MQSFNFKNFYVLILSLCATGVFAQGTSNPVRFVTIGEKVQDRPIPKILNFSRTSASLSDFRGKLLILDFWGTTCSPCIGAMPKVKALQKQFEDKVQFLSIAQDDEEVINQFFKRRPDLRLPMAVGVADAYRPLANQFGIPSLGIFVWIDTAGVVRAVTGDAEVTAENIQAMLSGKPVKLPLPTGYGPRIAFDYMTPLLINGNGGGTENLQYHSILTGMIPGRGSSTYWDGMDPKYSTKYANRRILETNSTFVNMYRVAFGQRKRFMYSFTRTKVELADTMRIAKGHPENIFCYELIVPEHLADKLQEIMKIDIDRYFGTTAKIERRKSKVLRLVDKQQPAELQLKALQPPYLGDIAFELQGAIEGMLRIPVVDATTGAAKMAPPPIPPDTPKTLEAVRTILARYGLALEESEEEIDFLVIRDAVPSSDVTANDSQKAARSSQ